jgi:hypothetical protein
MSSPAFTGLDTGDSQSIVAAASPNRHGVVALYASRLASTADVRTREKHRLACAEPVKFGRVTRTPQTNGCTDHQASAPRSRPTVPPQFLNVIAGHTTQSEPV